MDYSCCRWRERYMLLLKFRWIYPPDIVDNGWYRIVAADNEENRLTI